jgi:hypothetical protein
MIPDWAPAALFAVVGLVHLVPGLAAFSPAVLKRLYGGGAEGPVLLMLQHRGALLGLVGLLLLIAAFAPSWRDPAAFAGAVSMASYLLLWLGAAPAHRKPLQSIAVVDAIALPALLLAAWLTHLAG